MCGQGLTSDGQHIAMLVVECPPRLRCELQRTMLSLWHKVNICNTLLTNQSLFAGVQISI